MIHNIKTAMFLLLLGVIFGIHSNAFAQEEEAAAPAAVATGASGSGYSLDDSWSTLGLTEKPESLVGTQTEAKGDASDVTSFFQKMAAGLVTILTAVAIFFVVLNASSMVMSAGNSDKITKAKKALTWIILGLLVVIFAYVIVKTVISLPYSSA